MVGIVLVCENLEADEMLKTLTLLLGKQESMTSVILESNSNLAEMKKRLKASIESVDRGEGVLLLTDFYGSSQCRICAEFIEKGKLELVTGYNLPMLLKLASIQGSMLFDQLGPFIESYGREHIKLIDTKTLCPD